MRTEDLLKQSQSLAHELQSRQEELQNTNEELQEKARQLAHQNEEVENKNTQVEQARKALEEKAEQLYLTSKYKSEFLANMSHELRTPLNSLLILSDQLSKNPEGNLMPKQMEFAKTIHSAGNDLLMLINDILDLSKIESGTVAVDISELRLDDLRGYVERTFRHVAEDKKLDFAIRMAPELPRSMFSDAKRLQQVIKNLLSNAFKFTPSGQVTLTVEPVATGWSSDNEELNRAGMVLAFSVSDTGIGIPPDKQQIIFEAFQQADGSTSRKYGGTGLGLAISRELSRLLGGEIRLVSGPNRGSTFTLFLPQTYSMPRILRKSTASAAPAGVSAHAAGALGAWMAPAAPAPSNGDADARSRGNGDGWDHATAPAPLQRESPLDAQAVAQINEAGDDRGNLQPGDRILLIAENDLAFARVLLEAAREHGFKGLVTPFGAAALAMTREYQPQVVSLDILLPDIDGWRVLDRLKNDVATRHIPVCVISTEEARERALASGAMTFVAKPIKTRDEVDTVIDGLYAYVTRATKHVLVVEPDASKLARIRDCIDLGDVAVSAVARADDALDALAAEAFDCLVLGPNVPDLTPAVLADRIRRAPGTGHLPVIVYGDGSSFRDEGDGWKRLGASLTVRQVYSPERLLDQAALFLHCNIADLPDAKRRILEGLHCSDRVLPGKKVLIVDDDVRNIFALSTVLEEQDMHIVKADNGMDAIRILQAQRDVDIVLMDIMMPEMDGIDTMREIRKIPELKSLPIVAVTAKAMKGDREKCIEAGAWDYLSKPVDSEQLLAVLRAWLHR